MAAALRGRDEPVSIVVSSDMSHYVTHQQATERDRLALDRIEALDPEGLMRTVREHNISMCGAMPMTIGLTIARELGASQASIADYATSAEASGDYQQVVGYAAALIPA
jgi:hypothetical protein